MKSGRQRKDEIVAKRKRREASKRPADGRPTPPSDRRPGFVYPSEQPFPMPNGAVRANQELLLHDGTWGPRPAYYVDERFHCIDCGAYEVWRATQQKWWYEVAKGKLDSRAIRCTPCRRRVREKRARERHTHIEGLIAKYGIEDAAKRMDLTVEALQQGTNPLAREVATDRAECVAAVTI